MWFAGLFRATSLRLARCLLRGIRSQGLPRETLVSIAVRTAPWIYVAMSSTLITFGIYWLGGFGDAPAWFGWLYGLVLLLLVGNNVYGSLAAWPRIMFAPDEAARSCWSRFYRRAAVALALGLTILSASVVAS